MRGVWQAIHSERRRRPCGSVGSSTHDNCGSNRNTTTGRSCCGSDARGYFSGKAQNASSLWRLIVYGFCGKTNLKLNKPPLCCVDAENGLHLPDSAAWIGLFLQEVSQLPGYSRLGVPPF